jgi:hypothetical protein
MGVEPDHAGSGSFQAMFSDVDQRTGRFRSALRPFSEGPRHCGQFSASKPRRHESTKIDTQKRNPIRFVSSRLRGPRALIGSLRSQGF